jgi:small GTP-binding protein
MILNSSESLDDNTIEQRWLAIIQRLQTLITHALARSQVLQALRLWQALQTAMQALVDKKELPPLAFEQLLQKSFLLKLAPHVDRGTLKVIESWFSHALKLLELPEHLAEFKFTQAELYNLHLQAPTQCMATQPFDLSTLVENYQTRCAALSGYVYTYLSAADQSMLQTRALCRIQESEIDFLNALSINAWDAYGHLEDNTQRAASSALVTTASQTHCLALEWLVTLTEQQQNLATLRECVLLRYRARLIQLRQIYQAAVTAIPTAVTACLEVSKSFINAQRAFSWGVRQLLAQIIDDGEAILGSAPCTYTFIGFGSLSRDEMLPFSDLECGLLVPPDLAPAQARLAHAYLLALWQWFTFSLQSLAESGENSERLGIHLDHQLCPKVTSRGLEGCYGTPEQIFFDHLASVQDLGFAQAYSFMKPVYITGRTRNDGWNGFSLLHEYYRALTARIQQLQSTPSTVQQAVAWAQLPEHRQEWQELLRRSLTPATAIQIKADYATPLLCLIYDLALYYDVDIRNTLPPITTTQDQVSEQVTNTYDIITTLVEQKHLSPVFGHALRHAYTFLMYLRLNAQYHYQQQLELAVLPEAANSALETFYAKNPHLPQQLTMVFTKPTIANLYRLTPQAYTHLQRIRVFIFEPVVGLLKTYEHLLSTKQPLPWSDPLLDQFKIKVKDLLASTSPTASESQWICLFVEHLEASDARREEHLNYYCTLTDLQVPEDLRKAYLEALRQRRASTDSLVLELSTIPRHNGYRQSERLAYETLMGALHALSLPVVETTTTSVKAEAATATREPLRCAECDNSHSLLPFTIEDYANLSASIQLPGEISPRTLAPLVIYHLLDPRTGRLREIPLHQVDQVSVSHRHRVVPLKFQQRSQSHEIHIKENPDHPIMDYATYLLRQRLFGHGAPPNRLAKLTVESCHPQYSYNKYSYPILISMSVSSPEENLKTYLETPQRLNLSLRHFFELALFDTVAYPGDGSARNYQVTTLANGQHCLNCVDNDQYFVKPFEGKRLQLRSILFCFPQMQSRDEAPLTAALQAFIKLDIKVLLKIWLQELIQDESNCLQLFPREERKQHFQSDSKKDLVTLSLLFPEWMIFRLGTDLYNLQAQARLAYAPQLPTAFELLENLQDLVAHQYQQELAKQNASPQSRFSTITSAALVSKTSSQSLQASLGKIPTLQEVEERKYSPLNALPELALLEGVLNQQHSFVYVAANEAHLRVDFRKYPFTKKQQEVLLQLQLQRRYTHIVINHCQADKEILKALLIRSGSTLIYLMLSNCPQLTSTSLEVIANACPKLKKLSLLGNNNLISIKPVPSFYSSFFQQRNLFFPELIHLNLSYNKNLTEIELKAPQLKVLKAKHCPQLKSENIRLDVPQLQTLTPIDQLLNLVVRRDNYYLKIGLVGDNCAGKSALLGRYMRNDDLGLEIGKKTFRSGENTIHLTIIDEDKEDRAGSTIFRFPHSYLIAFDPTSNQSLENAKKQVEGIKKCVSEASMLLIMTKNQLLKMDKENAEKARKKAQEVANEIGAVGYIECSAETGENVDLVFETATKIAWKIVWLEQLEKKYPQYHKALLASWLDEVIAKSLSHDQEVSHPALPSNPLLTNGCTYLFNITTIGDDSAGKSTLLKRYDTGSFEQNVKSTIGVDFIEKTLQFGENTVHLQISDTPGQIQFRSIAQGCYRKAHVFILAFDLKNSHPLKNVDLWINEIKTLGPEVIPIIFIMTKCDLLDEMEGAEDIRKAAQQVAQNIGAVKYLECSAKTGKNVDRVFETAVQIAWLEKLKKEYPHHAVEVLNSWIDEVITKSRLPLEHDQDEPVQLRLI